MEPGDSHIEKSSSCQIFHLRFAVITNSVFIAWLTDALLGIEFSHGKEYMAVAERRDAKDFVSVWLAPFLSSHRFLLIPPLLVSTCYLALVYVSSSF
jgi:hypothetical protein